MASPRLTDVTLLLRGRSARHGFAFSGELVVLVLRRWRLRRGRRGRRRDRLIPALYLSLLYLPVRFVVHLLDLAHALAELDAELLCNDAPSQFGRALAERQYPSDVFLGGAPVHGLGAGQGDRDLAVAEALAAQRRDMLSRDREVAGQTRQDGFFSLRRCRGAVKAGGLALQVLFMFRCRRDSWCGDRKSTRLN